VEGDDKGVGVQPQSWGVTVRREVKSRAAVDAIVCPVDEGRLNLREREGEKEAGNQAKNLEVSAGVF